MKPLLRLCWDGIRANFLPGLILQGIACIVVGVYYLVPSSRPAYEWVGDLKLNYGYVYSGLSTAVFGGLIPFLYLCSVRRVNRGERLVIGVFFVLVWSWKGVEVDFLYRMQAWMFGEGTDRVTVAKKVLFDQFVFCPFWSAPVTALLYRWKDCGFSRRRFVEALDRKLFFVEIPSVLVSIWIVWIPGTAFIYSMPNALQVPLFTLVLCFFVLLVSVLGKARET